MATAGGDSNEGDNSDAGVGAAAGAQSDASGFGGADGNSNNDGRGFGDLRGQGETGRDTVKSPWQTRVYNLFDRIPHQAKEFGGHDFFSYHPTSRPDFEALMAKHQTGYTDPVTNEVNRPNLFNYDGTVYKFDPDNNVYIDTYTGSTIGPGGEDRGSLGIRGLYDEGNAPAQVYQPAYGGLDALPVNKSLDNREVKEYFWQDKWQNRKPTQEEINTYYYNNQWNTEPQSQTTTTVKSNKPWQYGSIVGSNK